MSIHSKESKLNQGRCIEDQDLAEDFARERAQDSLGIRKVKKDSDLKLHKNKIVAYLDDNLSYAQRREVEETNRSVLVTELSRNRRPRRRSRSLSTRRGPRGRGASPHRQVFPSEQFGNRTIERPPPMTVGVRSRVERGTASRCPSGWSATAKATAPSWAGQDSLT